MLARALFFLVAAPLARAGTVVGHGYITNTNEATGDVAVSLTGIAGQTGNYLTIVDDGAGAIFSVDVNGNAVSATNSYTSDGRFKANVTALGYGLAALKALRPVEFRWNEQAPARADRSKQLGFIAQEAEAVAPELVKTDARGYKSMLCAPESAPRGADRPRVSERRENARARGASPRALAGTTASASSRPRRSKSSRPRSRRSARRSPRSRRSSPPLRTGSRRSRPARPRVGPPGVV